MFFRLHYFIEYSMEINDIKKLAVSAKLNFTDEDLKDWQTQLQGVFTWIDKLQEVDTTGVALQPSAKPALLRADEIKPFENMQGLISDFKESEDNMAKVKKIL